MEKVFRFYLTDMLKFAVNNTAGGEKRSVVEKRYADIVERTEPRKPAKPEPTKEEIVARIRNKLTKLGGS